MTAPLTILQVVNRLARDDGGPAVVAAELDRALDVRPGVETTLAVVRRSAVEVATERAPVGALRGLLSLLARPGKRPDIVIVHGYYLGWLPWVVLLASLRAVPVLVMPHGALTTRQQGYSRLRKAVFDRTAGRLIRRLARAFVLASEVERRELPGFLSNVASLVLGIGIHLPPTPPSPRSVGAPVRLLSVSRLAPKKRVDVSIDTVGELVARGIDCRLAVAGTGEVELENGLRQRAVSAGVGDRVEFLGWVGGDDKDRLYAESDLFVLPSEDENFGLGPMEAMGHGLPVVVTSSVASSVHVSPRSGLVLAAPTAAGFADAVSELLARPDFGALRIEAHRDVVSSLDWDLVASRWERALREFAPPIGRR